MLREVIRLLHVTQLYKVEAASELGALVSGSQALSPVPAFPGGGLALSHRMTSFKGPANVALTDSESWREGTF